MNDESFVDASSVLDQSENWARESLHDHGYSDAFIDEWIQFDDGWDFETALELLLSEDDCKLLLIRRIQYLRGQLSNGDQSLIDWIGECYSIFRLQLTGSWSEIEELWFSELQSKNAKKKPRNRADVAKRAVAYILRKATGQGSDMDRFRHYAAGEPRLLGKNIDIEVTPVENNDGKIVKYRFFDIETFECKTIKEATVRGIIRNLNKTSPEKEGDDPTAGKVS